MIPIPDNDALNLIAVLLLLVIVGLFVRIEMGQRKAARLARDTESKASAAATRAGLAATASTKVLAEIKSLGIGNKQAAAQVAADLQHSHERAVEAASDVPGEAADAAALAAVPPPPEEAP